MTGVFEVGSVEETWALARQLAAELKPGEVICLEGDLGAGKTTFTQGLAAAMGVKGRVTSPTFCLVQEHRVVERSDEDVASPTAGQRVALRSDEDVASPLGCPVAGEATSSSLQQNTNPTLLVHMDLYRLQSEDDVLAIGWEDYLARGAVLVVEWPERAGTLIPSDARHIVFTHLGGEERRRIEFR